MLGRKPPAQVNGVPPPLNGSAGRAKQPLRWGEIVTQHGIEELSTVLANAEVAHDKIRFITREYNSKNNSTMDPFKKIEQWLNPQLRDPAVCRLIVDQTLHALQKRRPGCPSLPTQPLAKRPGNGTEATSAQWRTFGEHWALVWRDSRGVNWAAATNPLSLDLMRKLDKATQGQTVWLQTLAVELEQTRPVAQGSIEDTQAGVGRKLLFEWLLEASRTPGVSDLHMLVPINNEDPVGHVLFRQHGQIKKPIPDVPIERFLRVQRALLTESNRVSGDGDYKPYDEQINFSTDTGEAVAGRLSMVPYNHSNGKVYYSSSIRLLNAAQKPMHPNDAVGPFDRERARNLLDVDSGLVIVSGPTGSGKSTLLSSLLSTLYIERPGRRFMTVEDPIEIRIPGAQQFMVHEPQGLTFAKILRSLLRQDPDIVLVGEIRDEEVADIAVNLGLTGQTVYATCHATYAPTVAKRLQRLGIHPDDLAITLRRTTSQRLLSGCCPVCSPAVPLEQINDSRYEHLKAMLYRFTRDVLNDNYNEDLDARLKIELGSGSFRLPPVVVAKELQPNPGCKACHGHPTRMRLVLEELSWGDLSEGGPEHPETKWWDEAIIQGGMQPMWFRAAALLLKREITVDSFFSHFASYPPRLARMSNESCNLLGQSLMVESEIIRKIGRPSDSSSVKILPWVAETGYGDLDMVGMPETLLIPESIPEPLRGVA